MEAVQLKVGIFSLSGVVLVMFVGVVGGVMSISELALLQPKNAPLVRTAQITTAIVNGSLPIFTDFRASFVFSPPAIYEDNIRPL